MSLNNDERSILIVEDYVASSSMLSNAIKFNKKAQCDTVSSGQEALSKIKKHEYDIIITDMRMPTMDGIELIKAIRQYEHDNNISPQIIIAMSVDNLADPALEAGATMFYSKLRQPMRAIFDLIDQIKQTPSRRQSCTV